MTEFQCLQAELAKVENLSALSRACGISRDHLRRIRDSDVANTTLRTIDKIRAGLAQMAAAHPDRLPPEPAKAA